MIWRVPTMRQARALAVEAARAGRPVPTFEVASVPPKGTTRAEAARAAAFTQKEKQARGVTDAASTEPAPKPPSRPRPRRRRTS